MVQNCPMTTPEEKALEAATARLDAAEWGQAFSEAREAVLDAERVLARSRGQQFAEVIDLGAVWDRGAPLTHFISNGSQTVIVCRAKNTPADWDGRSVRVVSAQDSDESPLIVFTFDLCFSTRFGYPNDEVLSGHALYGRGLDFYQAHLVHNSEWIEEIDRINSVHPNFRPVEAQHYLLAFHDETFEVIAEKIDVQSVRGNLGDVLLAATRKLVNRE